MFETTRDHLERDLKKGLEDRSCQEFEQELILSGILIDIALWLLITVTE
jgi:hypothetical protein